MYALEFPTYACQAVNEQRLIAIQHVITAADEVIDLREHRQIEFRELILRTEVHIYQSRQMNLSTCGNRPTRTGKVVGRLSHF